MVSKESNTLQVVSKVLGDELFSRAQETFKVQPHLDDKDYQPLLGISRGAWNMLVEARQLHQRGELSDQDLLATEVLYGFVLFVLQHQNETEYQKYIDLIDSLHQELSDNDFPLAVQFYLIANFFTYLG